MKIKDPQTGQFKELYIKTLDNIPIGSIIPFSSNNIPTGYMLCDGSAISRTTYNALFTIIGTMYGVGDGSTTFNLPNLKGKVPIGYNSSETEFDNLGKTGGEKTHTLTVAEMPSHSHTVKGWADVADGSGSYRVSGADGASDTYSTRNSGGGQAHNNLPPYLSINYIIKVEQSVILNQNNGQLTNTYSNSSIDGYTCDYINDLQTYSTTERRVGTWVNNKPIYRKVINIGSISSGYILYPHGISNLQTFTKIEGYITNGNEWIPLNSVYRRRSSIDYDEGLLVDDIQIIYTSRADRTSYIGYIILEYTKTTD